MTTRTLVVIVSGLLSLGQAVAASAQVRWGRERVPQSGACFYEDRGFQGRYFCVAPGQDLRQMPNDMRDRISSIRVVGPNEVTVFQDDDMRGRSARFVGRDGWNDRISSIVVSIAGDRGAYGAPGVYRDDRGRSDDRDRGRYGVWDPRGMPIWGNQAVPREGACFYEDRDFAGRYFCIPRGAAYTSLPSGFNDRISSIRVFGGGVRIYRDRDFHGRSRQIKRDVRDLRGSWGDVISSVQVR